MLRERTQLGVQLRVIPVGLLDAGLEIVQHQAARQAAEVIEGVFQTTQERVGRLPPHRLAVAPARVAQHDAKDMRSPTPAVRSHDRSAAAEIDLHLVAGRTLHAAKGQRPTAIEALDKAADAVVLGGETVVANEVLEDALRGEAGSKLGLDDRPIGLTQTGLFRPGRRCRHADGRLAGLGITGAPRRVAGFDITGAPRWVAYFARRDRFRAGIGSGGL